MSGGSARDIYTIGSRLCRVTKSYLTFCERQQRLLNAADCGPSVARFTFCEPSTKSTTLPVPSHACEWPLHEATILTTNPPYPLFSASFRILWFTMPTSPSHLIIGCCHAIYLGGEGGSSHEANWLIESFQAGETPTYVKHIEAGVKALAEAGENAILVFSGGATKREQTGLSEAEGYLVSPFA